MTIQELIKKLEDLNQPDAVIMVWNSYHDRYQEVTHIEKQYLELFQDNNKSFRYGWSDGSNTNTLIYKLW